MKKMMLSLMGAVFAVMPLSLPAFAVERGGQMSFARYDDSVLIDPVWAERNPDIWMVTNLYDTLLRNGEKGALQPGLAEKHEVSADGKTITLTLRDGVKFSDGSALTADDVVFSLERARNPDGPWGNLLASVEAMKGAGKTVTLTMKQADPTIL